MIEPLSPFHAHGPASRPRHHGPLPRAAFRGEALGSALVAMLLAARAAAGSSPGPDGGVADAAGLADPSGPVLHVAPLGLGTPEGDGTAERPFGSLEQALGRASGLEPGLTILLAPGSHHLSPRPYVDPTCGNCQDPAQPVPATLGLRVSGRGIVLRGAGLENTTIYTHSGYGLLFEDCENCRLEDLTLTGGERDTSGNATDAAIVVRRARLDLARCRIADNLGDSATVARTVVGVMGVCGREGADLRIHACEIVRNSWDGIALYRDASAVIEDCLVDGMDSGRGRPDCGGRGVGIGVTWNARAVIRGNLVRRYWKGIGLFVDAEGIVQENIVEDVLTWGIALWDADRGRPFGDIAGNAVYRTGACGISVTRGMEGGREESHIVGNALVATGQNPRYDDGQTYCAQRALALEAVRPAVTIEANAFFRNREPGERPGALDMPSAGFRAAIAPLVARLRARPALAESAFLAEFGGTAEEAGGAGAR